MGNYARWWKPIKSFDGYYICENGRVGSIALTRKLALGYELSFEYLNKNKKGAVCRKRVSLYKNGKIYKVLVARLVAEAFIPNPENKPIVHHIDGNALNDDVTNLMWVTEEEHKELHRIMREMRKNNKRGA